MRRARATVGAEDVKRITAPSSPRRISRRIAGPGTCVSRNVATSRWPASCPGVSEARFSARGAAVVCARGRGSSSRPAPHAGTATVSATRQAICDGRRARSTMRPVSQSRPGAAGRLPGRPAAPSLPRRRSLPPSMHLRTAARATTVAGASLLLLAPVALAAPGVAGSGEDTPLNLPAERADQASAVGGGGGSIVRTIVGLAVVIGVIYGLSWVLRQVKASREERTMGHGLRPAATIALGPNRALHLVHAGRELVLVGVAEQGVTPIRTYTRQEAVDLGLIPDDALDADGDPVAPQRALSNPRTDGVGALLDAVRRRTQR
ncbi:hypothetical protein GKE82_14455 [Conexibacter sp. W3-3-2]|nr:hypothetical protein [Conexibacter sp. W3-3-2]